ncbi:MAG: M14 family metallopeptidase [Erysipelotrichaceae bacterium]|nr:M14 family metallopeptidase [Erysipelotrichaceae bacterium]
MKTTFNYDHYYKYEELKSSIEQLANEHPDIVEVENICTTLENRQVLAITVTNKKTGAATSKPGFHIDGNTHAGEVTGSMAALHTLDYVVTNYGVDEEITKMVDENTLYFVPRISPDGAETYLSTPYTLRSVNRDYLPEDGGLYGKDLDGDDVIRMMRIKTPYGAWKKDNDNPNLMVHRAPDDKTGDFYQIYTEGMIEDYDGVHIAPKKSSWGLDFNRNYPMGWFPESRQSGAGKYPLSNPENKAMVEWVLNHDNICGVLTHHTSGGVILYPPGTKPEAKAHFEDMKIFKAVGQMGKEEMGYPAVNIFDNFMIDQENYSSGAFDDWCYQNQGIYAYTVELWDLNSKIGMPTDWTKREIPSPKEQEVKFAAVVKWAAENAPEAFAEWKEFDHPQLGKVEIGGFNYKFLFQNPPCNLLKTEVENTTKFSLRFIKTLPQLVIDNVSVNEVSEGVYKVEALVSNSGYMPTYLSKEAKSLKVAKPVTVSISGIDEVVMGEEVTNIGDLNGFAHINSGAFFYGNITTGKYDDITKKVSWIVKAKKGCEITVTATHNKSGQASKTVIC